MHYSSERKRSNAAAAPASPEPPSTSVSQHVGGLSYSVSGVGAKEALTGMWIRFHIHYAQLCEALCLLFLAFLLYLSPSLCLSLSFSFSLAVSCSFSFPFSFFFFSLSISSTCQCTNTIVLTWGFCHFPHPGKTSRFEVLCKDQNGLFVPSTDRIEVAFEGPRPVYAPGE